MDGKVGQALRLLTHKSKGCILELDSHIIPDDPSSSLVRDLLQEKHPPDHDPHFVLLTT